MGTFEVLNVSEYWFEVGVLIGGLFGAFLGFGVGNRLRVFSFDPFNDNLVASGFAFFIGLSYLGDAAALRVIFVLLFGVEYSGTIVREVAFFGVIVNFFDERANFLAKGFASGEDGKVFVYFAFPIDLGEGSLWV